MMMVVAVVAAVVLLFTTVVAVRQAQTAQMNARRAHELAAQAVAEAKRADDRREAQFGSLVDLERERNDWQQRYQQHALEHGNAQALLFNEVMRVTSLARKKGVQVEVTPIVREAVLEYHEVHVSPQVKQDPSLKVITPHKEAE